MQRFSITKLFRVVTVAALLLYGARASSTDLRGRIDSTNAYTGIVSPRAGAEVALLAWNGTAWTAIKTAVTGPDGIYFLQGIAPGNYYIKVGELSWPVTVTSAPGQDVPPFLAQ